MPSFDVVSQVDMHEVTNAVDQANREVATRFDFKGTNSRFTLSGTEIVMTTGSEFQLKQMLDILRIKMSKRGIDIACLKVDAPQLSGKEARQHVTVRQGIESELAKQIVKMIKNMKLKVQAAIQGDQVRVTGKKRDDLQQVIVMLKEAEVDLPLQYINFRD